MTTHHSHQSFRCFWPYFVDNRSVEECTDFVTESTPFKMAVQPRCGLVLLCPSLDPRPPHQSSAARPGLCTQPPPVVHPVGTCLSPVPPVLH